MIDFDLQKFFILKRFDSIVIFLVSLKFEFFEIFKTFEIWNFSILKI